MVKFPLKFEVQANAASGISNNWTAQAGSLEPIQSAIPTEFMGPGGGYSPEDLFAISILNCLIALYKVYCEKSKVTFREIQAKAILTADKMGAGTSFHMPEVEIFLTVTGSSDPVRGRALLEAATKDCPVSNSIKSQKTFHLAVE